MGGIMQLARWLGTTIGTLLGGLLLISLVLLQLGESATSVDPTVSARLVAVHLIGLAVALFLALGWRRLR
jgi:hypothetical protein